jgi:(p)ppGpp synthase/HD superfamily hydrolase
LKAQDDLVFRAMRLAERAHRTRELGPHFRKAPEGEDRPAYFIHVTEVAWMLEKAGCEDALVAAGFLHDLIEDCDYTQEQLANEMGDRYVAELVAWVSEPEKDRTWEERNGFYLARMRDAPDDVLALSCADKTSNLGDMNRLVARGYRTQDFTSRDHATQAAKFEALNAVYEGRIPVSIYQRFTQALGVFRRNPG